MCVCVCGWRHPTCRLGEGSGFVTTCRPIPHLDFGAAADAVLVQVHDGTTTPLNQFMKDPDSLITRVTWKDEQDKV